MSEDLSLVLGPLEAEVMQVLWPAGKPMDVRSVLDTMNEHRSTPLAYTTVMTVMARLAEKEILTRSREGRSFAYEPVVPSAAAIAVRNVVRDFGDAAVAGLVDQARADPELRARLEQLRRDDPPGRRRRRLLSRPGPRGGAGWTAPTAASSGWSASRWCLMPCWVCSVVGCCPWPATASPPRGCPA